MHKIILIIIGIFQLNQANGIFNTFEIHKKSVTEVSVIEVHPPNQVAKEYEDVVIDCTERNNGKVFWERPKGQALPKGAVQHRGRLSIQSIEYSDGGEYICLNQERTHRATANVFVYRTTTTGYNRWKPGTLSFVTSGLPNTKSPTDLHTLVTFTPYPCTYGFCNGTCCKEDLGNSYFDCANGQKINKSLICNRENDCDDGSDESRCSPWPPKITVLPKHRVEVFCGDEEKERAGTLTLECQSVGHPTPVIMWRKYDGHVPSKCQQYSKNGHGILTCSNFQQSDQGAYSCVAKNSVKLAESQPKSIAKCINQINCRGFRVVNEEGIEHCLECYCSGKTSQCQSIKSNIVVKKFPFPSSKTEIFASETGEILFIPTKSDPAPATPIRESAQEITYCTLSESDFEEISFLKSFGRNIIIPRYKGKTDFSTKAPDLIIRGNGLSLMYRANLIAPPKESLEYMSVRFWPGNWHHVNKKAASREDLMKVLSNVDALFVRCEYQQAHSVTWKNATISLESSVITNSATFVSYVEKCHCPAGFDGLSCETCAAGYKKIPQGSDFTCEKIYVPPPCKEGYIRVPGIGTECNTCDAAKGYVRKGELCIKPVCHPDGSVRPSSSGKCTCKVGVRGEFCDECADGYFHLNRGGCQKCWCSGVTDQCKSSDLHRSVISSTPRGGYNSSDGRNFWLLPSDFSGNRLTSYGGYLNYTIKYKPDTPKESTYLTVEILTVDDVTLIYTHREIDRSKAKTDKSWSVPLFETYWNKFDKSLVSRGEFLTALSKIKAIYIESPYHLSSGLANLTSTMMSSATSGNSVDAELALAVEQCNCPTGYTGLSCESCSHGYYKKRKGTVIQCIKCNCSNCDPEFGCPDCPRLTYRDNPESEKMPVCKPCPCNGNGISCVKDDFNQIFCRCKSGYTGMHCENIIPKEADEFTITISPRKIRGKKVGTEVSLNCSFSSNEDMVLQVKKTYRAQTKSPSSSNWNHTRTITNQGRKKSKSFQVVLEDGLAAIECLVHDARGKLAGHVVAEVEDLITVVKPVRIKNCYSDRIDIKESESKDIICEATGSPAPVVNWYILTGTNSEKLDTSDGVHSIESASLKDNGTIYTCIAENSEGDKATCTQVLIVRKKCEVINIFPKVARVEEQKNVSIECKTTAKSPVTWSLLDSSLGKISSNFSARVKINGGHLQIINSEVSDSGTYICLANGSNGVINNTVVVVIEEKKEAPVAFIDKYDVVLKAGETFEVTCTGTGKPIPHITWRKLKESLDSNVVVRGNGLTITKAVTSNSGIYECEAKSISGTDTKYISIGVEEVKYPPRVNISEENIVAHDGDEVTLTCLAVGYPRPRLTWFAPNITLKTVSRKDNSMVLIEPNESVKEEVIFTVAKQMEGLRITCDAENLAGRSQKSTVVKVLQLKGGINETVEFVSIGSYFELHCDYTEDLEVEKVGGFVGDECTIPNGLMIPSVQIQHNGTYICKAHSTPKKIINLMVVGFVPKFIRASKSFLVLPVTLPSSHDLRVEVSFNAASENGLILKKDNDKFAIYLEENIIRLIIHHNAGHFLNISTLNPIQLNRWFSLVVTINTKYVDITVYDEKSKIHDRKTENGENLNISMGHGSDSFFVGGYRRNRHPMRFFTRSFPHFDGCVSRLKINHHEFDIIQEGSFSQNVTLCKRCSEDRNLCHERGKCLDAPTQYGFICVCPNEEKNKGKTCAPSCVGKGCETQLDLCKLLTPCSNILHKCDNNMDSLQCNCAFGYAGTTCEKVQEYSFCAKGNGFVRLPSKLLERRLGAAEIIAMAFTLHQLNGQLLWQGDNHNYLSIAVVDGVLRYTYVNQYSKLSVHASNSLELEKMHKLRITRVNGTVILKLSDPKMDPEIRRNSTLKFNTNRVAGDIYLGNVPSHVVKIGHHVGLSGCIHYVSFGDKGKINLPENELEKFNVFKPSKQNSVFSESDEESYNDLDFDYESQVELFETLPYDS